MLKPTTVICEKGPRSYEAARLLKNMGHKEVQYFAGGATFLNEINNEYVVQIDDE